MNLLTSFGEGASSGIGGKMRSFAQRRGAPPDNTTGGGVLVVLNVGEWEGGGCEDVMFFW